MEAEIRVCGTMTLNDEQRLQLRIQNYRVQLIVGTAQLLLVFSGIFFIYILFCTNNQAHLIKICCRCFRIYSKETESLTVRVKHIYQPHTRPSSGLHTADHVLRLTSITISCRHLVMSLTLRITPSLKEKKSAETCPSHVQHSQTPINQ